ncbi:MAG: anthranilate phosphoribosyltransferase, partial [Spirochaetota bacterium]|nr:anthranilate phosphoribosyltransferase [Spirochaetota bacterium]
MEQNSRFGSLINDLINCKNHSREEIKDAFTVVLNNHTTDFQQGAFLAALSAKGETAEEVAGAWEAIYNIDTLKTSLYSDDLVENCGTGMDSLKTFNISTAASIIAAAAGVKMARHGSRAITSFCGTVDIAEALGVDVDCNIKVIEESIEKAGIGLFNGMSSQIHPSALGRVLSQISFGSTLNIAASLANPALPRIAVRGVYSKKMLMPVAEVMKEIGYKRAIVLYGSAENSDKGMDEASVCGTTYCVEINKNIIGKYTFQPEDFGLDKHKPELLYPKTDIDSEIKSFLSLLI